MNIQNLSECVITIRKFTFFRVNNLDIKANHKIFDEGSHLHFPNFRDSRTAVIARSQKQQNNNFKVCNL